MSIFLPPMQWTVNRIRPYPLYRSLHWRLENWQILNIYSAYFRVIRIRSWSLVNEEKINLFLLFNTFCISAKLHILLSFIHIFGSIFPCLITERCVGRTDGQTEKYIRLFLYVRLRNIYTCTEIYAHQSIWCASDRLWCILKFTNELTEMI